MQRNGGYCLKCVFNERLQQEMGEPLGLTRPILRVLQFLPDTLQHPRDARDASWHHRSRVGSRGTARVMLQPLWYCMVLQ